MEITDKEQEAISFGIQLVAELRELSELPRPDELSRMVEFWRQSLRRTHPHLFVEMENGEHRLVFLQPRPQSPLLLAVERTPYKQAIPDDYPLPISQTHE
jgi:hypothetical protein